jgi:hypothetical protein
VVVVPVDCVDPVDVPPAGSVGGTATLGSGPLRIQLLLKVFQCVANQFETGGTPA